MAERSEASLPELPLTYRPLGVRIAAAAFGAMLLLTVGAIWWAFPAEVRAEFSTFQRLTVLLMGAGVVAIGYALARSRIDLDRGGLTVVNGYRTHRLEWSQVVAVSLRSGSPWVVLDLSDGTAIPAMGIQGSDGLRARRQARELRRLVEAHAGTEPQA